jgi:hypothetical protein
MAELPRQADVAPEQAQVPIRGPGEIEPEPSEVERGDAAAIALAPAQAPTTTTPADVGIAAELAVKRPHLEAFERLLEKSPDSRKRIDIRLGGYSPPMAGTGYPQACEPYTYAFDVIAQEFSEHAALDNELLSQVIPQLAFDAVVDRGWHSGVKYAIKPLTRAAPVGPLPETKWTPFGSYWVHTNFLEGYIYRFGLNCSITKWYAEKQLRELSFRSGSARAVKEAELAPADVERQLYGGVPMTDRVPAQAPEAPSETVLTAAEERERLDAFILQMRDGGMQHPDICKRLDAARFESRWSGFSWQQAYRKHPGRVKTWLSKATKRAVTRRSYLELPSNSVTR